MAHAACTNAHSITHEIRKPKRTRAPTTLDGRPERGASIGTSHCCGSLREPEYVLEHGVDDHRAESSSRERDDPAHCDLLHGATAIMRACFVADGAPPVALLLQMCPGDKHQLVNMQVRAGTGWRHANHCHGPRALTLSNWLLSGA